MKWNRERERRRRKKNKRRKRGMKRRDRFSIKPTHKFMEEFKREENFIFL